jgi:hypothetical protein
MAARLASASEGRERAARRRSSRLSRGGTRENERGKRKVVGPRGKFVFSQDTLRTENQIEGEIGKEVSTECQIGKKFFSKV